MRGKIGLWITTLLVATSVAYGAGRYQEVSAYVTDDVRFMKEGQAIQLRNPDNTKVSPLNYQGRLYVPLRSLAELTDMEVQWQDSTRTVMLGAPGTIDGETAEGYNSISAVHYNVFKALRNKDYKSLASLVHPQKGVRFSLNGVVTVENDVVLKASDLANPAIGVKDYTWGAADGSGEPITETVNQLMDLFNRDFENSTKSGHGSRVTTQGISETPEVETARIEGGESVYTNGVLLLLPQPTIENASVKVNAAIIAFFI